MNTNIRIFSGAIVFATAVGCTAQPATGSESQESTLDPPPPTHDVEIRVPHSVVVDQFAILDHARMLGGRVWTRIAAGQVFNLPGAGNRQIVFGPHAHIRANFRLSDVRFDPTFGYAEGTGCVAGTVPEPERGAHRIMLRGNIGLDMYVLHDGVLNDDNWPARFVQALQDLLGWRHKHIQTDGEVSLLMEVSRRGPPGNESLTFDFTRGYICGLSTPWYVALLGEDLNEIANENLNERLEPLPLGGAMVDLIRREDSDDSLRLAVDDIENTGAELLVTGTVTGRPLPDLAILDASFLCPVQRGATGRIRVTIENQSDLAAGHDIALDYTELGGAAPVTHGLTRVFRLGPHERRTVYGDVALTDFDATTSITFGIDAEERIYEADEANNELTLGSIPRQAGGLAQCTWNLAARPVNFGGEWGYGIALSWQPLGSGIAGARFYEIQTSIDAGVSWQPWVQDRDATNPAWDGWINHLDFSQANRCLTALYGLRAGQRYWYRARLLGSGGRELTGWSNVADATVESWSCSCGDNTVLCDNNRFCCGPVSAGFCCGEGGTRCIRDLTNHCGAFDQ